MADFKISGRMSVANVKKQMQKEFKVTLRFYKSDGTLADDSDTLASLRTKSVKIDDMKIMGNMMAKGLKHRFRHAFGMEVDVAKEDNSELLHPDVTLRKAAEGKFVPEPKKPRAKKTKEEAAEFDAEIVMTAKDPKEVTLELVDLDYDEGASLLVNWGDGSPVEKFLFEELKDITKKYDKSGEFTITISTEGDFRVDEVICSNNNLTSLDASNCGWMKRLNCSRNKLTSLTLPEGCLDALDCSYNELTELVSIDNELDSVDGLNCSNNKIEQISLENHYCLTNIDCSNNQLSGEALDELFDLLSISSGTINIQDNPGVDDCDTDLAEDWEFEW